MKDILPREMEIRDYVMNMIQETYKTFGFTHMETPCMEHIENLCSKQGGDNEKLIFKVLKRGEKLKLAEAKEENDVVDCGLRYDLTVPLSRYYSEHVNELPSPFKALQMGYVWRADRPQRGRYRQFMQCDIDILGEPSYLAEIELILATSTLLSKLNFKQFTIHINNRKILKAMADYSGFPKEDYDKVFVILDKMDKIGRDGVSSELLEAGYSQQCVDTYTSLFDQLESGSNGIKKLKEILGDCLDDETAADMITIMDTVNATKSSQLNIEFDPTLVRGMSYYTGTIFEIYMDEFGSAVGGGGRYDEMIGKFTGTDTCACGFSIGFERIVMLLLESDYQVPTKAGKKAFLIDKKVSGEQRAEILAKAMDERRQGVQVNVSVMKKNKKFQKDLLMQEGYTDIKEFYAD